MSQPTTPTERPTPPKPPAPKKAAPKATDEPKETASTIEHEVDEEQVPEEHSQDQEQEGAEGDPPFDADKFLDEVETALAGSSDIDTLNENWLSLDAEAVLERYEEKSRIAIGIYRDNEKRIKDSLK